MTRLPLMPLPRADRLPRLTEVVVKIGHVGPPAAASPTWARTTRTAPSMAIEELNAKGVKIGGKKASSSCWPKTTPPIRSRAPPPRRSWSTARSTASSAT
jgi:hypothetical protein